MTNASPDSDQRAPRTVAEELAHEDLRLLRRLLGNPPELLVLRASAPRIRAISGEPLTCALDWCDRLLEVVRRMEMVGVQPEALERILRGLVVDLQNLPRAIENDLAAGRCYASSEEETAKSAGEPQVARPLEAERFLVHARAAVPALQAEAARLLHIEAAPLVAPRGPAANRVEDIDREPQKEDISGPPPPEAPCGEHEAELRYRRPTVPATSSWHGKVLDVLREALDGFTGDASAPGFVTLRKVTNSIQRLRNMGYEIESARAARQSGKLDVPGKGYRWIATRLLDVGS